MSGDDNEQAVPIFYVHSRLSELRARCRGIIYFGPRLMKVLVHSTVPLNTSLSVPRLSSVWPSRLLCGSWSNQMSIHSYIRARLIFVRQLILRYPSWLNEVRYLTTCGQLVLVKTLLRKARQFICWWRSSKIHAIWLQNSEMLEDWTEEEVCAKASIYYCAWLCWTGIIII